MTGWTRLDSGGWTPPRPSLPPVAPPVDFVKEYPYGQRCKICGHKFRSKKARDPECHDCREEIDTKTEQLETNLESVENARPEIQKEALEEIKEKRACQFVLHRFPGGEEIKCGWSGNATRQNTALVDVRLVPLHLRDWIRAELKHYFAKHYPKHTKEFWKSLQEIKRFERRLIRRGAGFRSRTPKK